MKHDQSHKEPETREGFWRSRTGIGLVFFLAVTALLLGYEHRMHLFTGNAFVVLLLLGCVVMHFFMHGGHGGGPGKNGDQS